MNKPDHYLRWLDDKAWEACGYDIKKEEGFYNLYRKPLRRFEDLENTGIKNIQVFSIDRRQYVNQILKIIEELQNNNPTLLPDDIGIMFLENYNVNYELANELQIAIEDKFEWSVNIGYESKVKRKGTVFVSNRNNVKGLEFPFVICVMQSKLDRDLQNRNSIYMMLTRSFITSYFILPNDEENIDKMKQGVDFVNKNGYLHVKEPDLRQRERLYNTVINRSNVFKSQHDIVEEIMDRIKIEKTYRNKIHKIIQDAFSDEFDREKLYDIIRMNYSCMI